MDVRFTVGEMARMNGLSKQMLIYYDREGVFSPKHVDPSNHYRYYTADQLEQLDSILVLREMGLSLQEIKEHMKRRTGEQTLTLLREQQLAVQAKVHRWSMIEARLAHKIQSLEQFYAQSPPEFVFEQPEEYLAICPVGGARGLLELDLALKELLRLASKRGYPHFYQLGGMISADDLRRGDYLRYDYACLPLEHGGGDPCLHKKPAGFYAHRYHFGAYPEAHLTYEAMLREIERQGLRPVGYSYEYCVLDSLTSRNPDEYITEIRIGVERMEPAPKKS